MNDKILINDIVKEYPNMLKIVIYHQGYYLPTNSSDRKERKKLNQEQKREMSIQRSVRRSRSVVQDIILSNQFTLWTTFTFNPNVVNRFDIAACKTKMSTWLFNQRYHSPNLKYLIVPEFHDKCEQCSDAKLDSCSHPERPKAIHFHALIANFNGKLTLTKNKTKRGQEVYKFSGYRSGISHAVYISNQNGDYERIATYIQKYITKDMPLIHNKSRYWRSRNIELPKKTINGVNLFNLHNIIKNHTPDYINNCYEVQYHQKLKTNLTSDNQVLLL